MRRLTDVLLRLFELLQKQPGLSTDQRDHVEGRRRDIAEECSQISREDLWQSLTGGGKAIAHRIFSVIDSYKNGVSSLLA